MVAFAFGLDMIPIPDFPQGGSLSLCAIPIIYYALRRGGIAGMSAGVVFACLKMMIKFYMPPAGTLAAAVICVLADYIFAFGLLGAAGFVYKAFAERKSTYKLVGAALSALVANFLRFVCHYISGVTIWESYAGEEGAWIYSLVYNGGYMLPNAIISAVLTVMLCMALDPKTLRPGLSR